MKASVTGLLIAALAFGASTFYLTKQLNDERVAAEKLASETQALKTRIAELEEVRAERRIATTAPFASVATAAGGMAMSPPPPPTENNHAEAQVEEGVIVNGPPRSEAFFRMMRSQVRASNKRTYADVGEQLGLSKEEANKLIDLLTDQQVEGFTGYGDVVKAGWRDHKAEIANLLGDSQAQALEEYRESIPARQELEALSRQLEGADSSFSDDQRKRMLAVLMDERARIPAPHGSNSLSEDEHIKAYAAWQTDYADRVDSRVRSILNSDQLTVYNEYQQWQKEIREQMATVRPLPVPQGASGGNIMFTTAVAVAGDSSTLVQPAEAAEKPSQAQ